MQVSIHKLVFKEHPLNSALWLLIHCLNHCLKLFLTPCNKAQLIFSFTPIMGTFSSWLQWKWVFGDTLRGSIWYCQVQQMCYQEILPNRETWPGNIHLWNVTFCFPVRAILPYIAHPAPHSLIQCHILLCNQIVAWYVFMEAMSLCWLLNKHSFTLNKTLVSF